MRIISSLLIASTLSFGCASSDWIQRTQVTVDVTGTWRGTGGNVELTLEQSGAKVAGTMRLLGIQSVGRITGAIEGSVAGETFRFKQASGNDNAVNGEMTVAGDEMAGVVRSATFHPGRTVLRRVSSSGSTSQSQ